jgi:hypothetical protein
VSKGDKVLEAFIPGLFPSLNDILRVRSQDRRHGWSDVKRSCENAVAKVIGAAKMIPKVPYRVEFEWVEWNIRRDPDNVASGGCKPIFDALIKIGIIEDDGWDYFGEIIHRYSIAKTKDDIGVHVRFYRDQNLIDERREQLKKSRGSHPPRNKRVVKPRKSRKKRKTRKRKPGNSKMGFKGKKKKS